MSVTLLQVPGDLGKWRGASSSPRFPGSRWQRQFSALPADGDTHASAGEGCRGALEVHLRGLASLGSQRNVGGTAGHWGILRFFALFTDSIKLIISAII